MVFEVLSASTEQYDRGVKWEGYQRISSLTDYVLVSQARPRVEHFQRQSDDAWRYRVYGTGDRLTLANGATVAIDDIYSGVFELQGE
jgi:Uma2 family endonuclease